MDNTLSFKQRVIGTRASKVVHQIFSTHKKMLAEQVINASAVIQSIIGVIGVVSNKRKGSAYHAINKSIANGKPGPVPEPKAWAQIS